MVQQTLDAAELYAYLSRIRPLMGGGKIVGFKLGKRDYTLKVEFEDMTATYWGNIEKVSTLMAEADAQKREQRARRSR